VRFDDRADRRRGDELDEDDVEDDVADPALDGVLDILLQRGDVVRVELRPSG